MPKKFITAILIGVLAISAFFLLKSKLPPGGGEIPSDWETYESTRWKVSFGYPPDWELNEFTVNPNMLNVSFALQDKTQEKIEVYTDKMYPSYNIQITAQENKEGLSPMDFYLQNFGDSSKEQARQKTKAVKYGGVSGIAFDEGAAPASGPAKGVLLAKGNYMYRFMYGALATEKTHEKYMSVFKQILGSIEFLE